MSSSCPDSLFSSRLLQAVPAFESALLRSTLLEVLKENQSLRNTLHVMVANTEQKIEQPPHVQIAESHPVVVPQVPNVAATSNPAPTDLPSAPSTRPTTKRHIQTRARQIALERYREKRKRRIEQNPHLAEFRSLKYSKMKAVAEAKKRDSEGKFIKKAAVQQVEPVVSLPFSQV